MSETKRQMENTETAIFLSSILVDEPHFDQPLPGFIKRHVAFQLVNNDFYGWPSIEEATEYLEENWDWTNSKTKGENNE
jgi:hypothetical protein